MPLALLGGCVLLLAVAVLLVGANSKATTTGDPGLASASQQAQQSPDTTLNQPIPTLTLPAQPLTGDPKNRSGLAQTPLDPAKPLAGRRIGLDAGHGLRGDTGAILIDPNTDQVSLSEADLTLDIVLRTRDLLVARGAAVTLTRETSDAFTAPWPPDTNGDGTKEDQFDDLQERVDILNAANVEVFLSAHINSAGDTGSRQGLQVFYCGAVECPFPAEDKSLGAIVLDQLHLQLDNAGVNINTSELLDDTTYDGPDQPATHLFMIGPTNPPHHVRATQMPGVVSESLYISSPTEAAQLQKGGVRQAIALAYADALQQYLTSNK